MSVVWQRLQSLTKNTPRCKEGTKNWIFRDQLTENNIDFSELVRIHPLLEIEYSVYCNHLVHNFARAEKKAKRTQQISEQEQNQLTEQLLTALANAELLAHIYHYYLGVPREVLRLQKEQKLYRNLLKMRGYKFDNTAKLVTQPTNSNSQFIRGNTIRFNWHRLFVIRTRRVFMTLLPLMTEWEKFTKVVNFVDRFLGPTLNYLAWVFYLPRLATNLFLLLKHVFPNQWTGMAEKEEDLSRLTRTQAHLQRRWFQLGNDSVWFIGGVLGCFVLTGALAPAGMYVSVSIFFIDVILASVRAFIEMRRIKELRAIYYELESNCKGEDELKEIKDFQDKLEERFCWEQRRVMLGVFSTSALFLAMCLALPILAFNPVIPLIGAVLVITITLTTFLITQWIERNSPASNVKKIKEQGETLLGNRYTLFQPPSVVEKQSVNRLEKGSSPMHHSSSQIEQTDSPSGMAEVPDSLYLMYSANT